MAAALAIPVIDHYDYILRQSAEWAHDTHWNPAGVQWDPLPDRRPSMVHLVKIAKLD